MATNTANSARVAQGARIEEDTRRPGASGRPEAQSKPPSEAAADIVRAIETRAPRLLIGNDAKRMELLQRLFPISYWRRMAGAFR